MSKDSNKLRKGKENDFERVAARQVLDHLIDSRIIKVHSDGNLRFDYRDFNAAVRSVQRFMINKDL